MGGVKKTDIDKKAVFGWVMYDFANSAFTTLVVTFVYATYFTGHIAADEISGTILWSRAVSVSAVAVGLLAPFLGAVADQRRNRKPFLFFFTLVTVGATALLATVLPGQVMAAMGWFVVANIAFELGCVFYNALLPDIAGPDRVGWISGLGWGLGYGGGLAALGLAMVGFVSPEKPWFGVSRHLGAHIRATNLLTACWLLVFSLPLFFFVREKKRPAVGKKSLAAVVADLADVFREVRKYPQVFRLLAARLLYNDGLVTVFAFGGIYAAGTFGFTFHEIMLFGIVLNVAAGAGALVMGIFDNYAGGKKTVQLSVVGLIGAVILAVLAREKIWLWIAGVVIGFFSGPNQSASRSLLARFTPSSRKGLFFGLFAFSGKFTAFLGPFFFGLLTDIFASQRAGVAGVVVFLGLGGLLLATVDEKAGIADGER